METTKATNEGMNIATNLVVKSPGIRVARIPRMKAGMTVENRIAVSKSSFISTLRKLSHRYLNLAFIPIFRILKEYLILANNFERKLWNMNSKKRLKYAIFNEKNCFWRVHK